MTDKERIEKIGRYRYYDFTEETIVNIVNKDIEDVTDREWRTLTQMLYPKNMIASGLFDYILIFEISKEGQRVDPPIEAYNSITAVYNKICLLLLIMEVLEIGNYKCHPSWYIRQAEIKLDMLKNEG